MEKKKTLPEVLTDEQCRKQLKLQFQERLLVLSIPVILVLILILITTLIWNYGSAINFWPFFALTVATTIAVVIYTVRNVLHLYWAVHGHFTVRKDVITAIDYHEKNGKYSSSYWYFLLSEKGKYILPPLNFECSDFRMESSRLADVMHCGDEVLLLVMPDGCVEYLYPPQYFKLPYPIDEDGK